MAIRSAALGAVRASEWNTHVLVRGCAENGAGCINLSTISILITRHGPKHCASSHGIQSCASECWPASGPVGRKTRERRAGTVGGGEAGGSRRTAWDVSVRAASEPYLDLVSGERHSWAPIDRYDAYWRRRTRSTTRSCKEAFHPGARPAARSLPLPASLQLLLQVSLASCDWHGDQ